LSEIGRLSKHLLNEFRRTSMNSVGAKTYCGWIRLKRKQRAALLLLFVCAALAAFKNFASAQQIDAAVGFGSITAPGSSVATGTDHQPQTLGGGAYFSASGDYLFYKNAGIEGEAAIKGDQSTYLPYQLDERFHPMFFALNAIWDSQKYFKRVGVAVEVLGGAGALSSRFQTGTCTSSKCFATSTHFLVDGGVGIKMYVWRHWFVRPEGRFYFIRNNTEFSSARAMRYGVSIGYTFR